MIKQHMEDVESESKHVMRILKGLLLLPLTLILVLFRKKRFSDLFSPIKDSWNFFWDAKVVAILILLNVGVFAFFMIDDITGNNITGLHDEKAFEDFADKYLASGPQSIREGNFIPFFASWFMHGSLAHLLGNMLALFILGRVVEKNFGAPKTLMIYIISGIISEAADIALHFNQLGYHAIGASGAISGIASAAMLVQPFSFTYLFMGLPIPIFIIAWLQLWSDIIGVFNPDPTGNIAHIAHLGGFFAIAIIAFFLTKEDKSKLKKGLMINLVTLFIIAAAWWFFFRLLS
jgi:membrane associated rhomboid family serine protease